ncbi:hypothetical protein L484_002748 [Morus notabilis]|uniref:Uncharacterized protein n=1 Tax=Morus notabilis TaxID=981085 RepID=W9QWE8_9ROSA|nr:uncharacterized protein LOC21386306 [Morus notabilis]EXB22633.1 hypothetical protein L484_002748 [Morus notabilis]
MSNYKITLEELQKYHKTDRKMFPQLILDMMREPGESLLIIATWLWLKERSFPDIIGKTVGVSDILVGMLADEAVIFLKSLDVSTPRMQQLKPGMHFTSHDVMDQKLSLQTFDSANERSMAIAGIKNILQTVCSRVFNDILLCFFFGTPHVVLDRPLLVPGFPHPLFGSLTMSLLSSRNMTSLPTVHGSIVAYTTNVGLCRVVILAMYTTTLVCSIDSEILQ